MGVSIEGGGKILNSGQKIANDANLNVLGLNNIVSEEDGRIDTREIDLFSVGGLRELEELLRQAEGLKISEEVKQLMGFNAEGVYWQIVLPKDQEMKLEDIVLLGYDKRAILRDEMGEFTKSIVITHELEQDGQAPNMSISRLTSVKLAGVCQNGVAALEYWPDEEGRLTLECFSVTLDSKTEKVIGDLVKTEEKLLGGGTSEGLLTNILSQQASNTYFAPGLIGMGMIKGIEGTGNVLEVGRDIKQDNWFGFGVQRKTNNFSYERTEIKVFNDFDREVMLEINPDVFGDQVVKWVMPRYLNS